MKIHAYRITNFKSIIDTEWRKFSLDGVTVLVGQNESGKTSILEALAKTFSAVQITADDIRFNASLPEVFIKLILSETELSKILIGYNQPQTKIVKNYFKIRNWTISFRFYWELNTEDNSYNGLWGVVDDKLSALLESSHNQSEISSNQPVNSTVPSEAPIQPTGSDQENKVGPLTANDVFDAIYDLAPRVTFFEYQSGMLPNIIDIDDKNNFIGDGAAAVKNYLLIADLTVEKIINADLRTRSSLLKKANDKISKDFAEFWSQTIGKTNRLQLECDLQIHGSNAPPEKIGKPFFVFWISDGLKKLHPKQRSQGVRWFVSFYLQLKASELSRRPRIFLLDEPGSNLHEKAQSDVLRLINKLSKDIVFVYSTHSPHMIEYDKWQRVHAVQRIDGEDDSPTTIIEAHHLGSASSDTLSPILSAMGADLSRQAVIRKINNVILEEISGFYYLSAFWKLLNETQEANFIAATGVDKVENLANMFRGWGLDFIIVIDDDQHGRGVYNSLMRNLFADDQSLAKENMLKLPDCKGVEDVFSHGDFKRFVLQGTSAKPIGENSNFLKTSGLSKPVLGYQFLDRVRSGEIKFKMLDEQSQKKIQHITSEIKSRLVAKQSPVAGK